MVTLASITLSKKGIRAITDMCVDTVIFKLGDEDLRFFDSDLIKLTHGMIVLEDETKYQPSDIITNQDDHTEQRLCVIRTSVLNAFCDRVIGEHVRIDFNILNFQLFDMNNLKRTGIYSYNSLADKQKEERFENTQQALSKLIIVDGHVQPSFIQDEGCYFIVENKERSYKLNKNQADELEWQFTFNGTTVELLENAYIEAGDRNTDVWEYEILASHNPKSYEFEKPFTYYTVPKRYAKYFKNAGMSKMFFMFMTEKDAVLGVMRHTEEVNAVSLIKGISIPTIYSG